MNTKAIGLGIVTALSFSSNAFSADAIVAAAPEPMDYVKVCDTFGTGYFYIPGTETCLKLGGLVRYDITIASNTNSTTNTMTGRLEVNANNQTELGQAYSFMRLDFYSTDNVSSNDARFYGGIGGFEFGNWDNQWQKFFNWGVGNTWSQGDYANFTDGQRQYISYTADFGAGKAYLSLDNDASVNNYLPDVSGGVSFASGDTSGGLGFGYDESLSSYALKGVVRGKISGVDVGLMGLYASESNSYLSHKGYGIQAGFGANLTEKATIGATVQYFQDTGATAIGNVTWNVATGFQTMVEVQYVADTNVTSGFLRFERAF